MKTSELTGAALDWAVATCEGVVYDNPAWTSYSTDWAQGGPIIEREKIGVFHYIHGFHGPRWHASIGSGGFGMDGPTPLIAAMRCYVASKLGDDVDVPEELI